MARRRELSEVRRTEILEAAVHAITERGWCATRITDVAERAGASPALVIHYFQTRDRLLGEALVYREENFYEWTTGELATAGGPTKDKLVRLLLATCALGEVEGQTEAWVLWPEVWVRALRDPDLAAQRQKLDQRWRDTIADLVRHGKASGEFGPADPDEFALYLSALIDGLAVQLVLRDPVISKERMFDLSIKTCARELQFDWTAKDRARVLGQPVPAARRRPGGRVRAARRG